MSSSTYSKNTQTFMDAAVIVAGYSLTGMLLPRSISGMLGVLASASGAALVLGAYSGNRTMGSAENSFKENLIEVGFAVGGIVLLNALGFSGYLTAMESQLVGGMGAILITNTIGGFVGLYAADYMGYIGL